MTIEAPIAVDMRALGFLAVFPGREYRSRSNIEHFGRGKLLLQVVSIRALSDVVIEPAVRRGLALAPAFDDAHPDFVMLEAIGTDTEIAGLTKDLETAGYRNLDTAHLMVSQQKSYELTRGGEGLDGLPDFMTEKEVARYLGKSLASVQRFSDMGGLPYITLRPRLIAKADLLEFLKTLKTVRPVSVDWQRERSKYVPYGMGVTDTPAKQTADARAWAMKMKMKPVRRRRKPDATA